MSENREELDLAYYSERVAAYGIDLSLAILGYFLSMKTVFPQYGLLTNPHCYAWTWAWIALFLAYEGFANADGRQSWGKALVGIRVVDLEGRPLTLGRSLLRSAGYLLSSLFYLGYLWPLFNHRVQAWHDLLAKSVVIQDDSRPARNWVVGGAWAAVTVVLAHWVWVFVLSGPYYRIKTIANARVGLHQIASLERRYFDQYGHYAESVASLAKVTGAPEAFVAATNMMFDTDRGLSVEPRGKGIRISAYARDDKNTPIHLDVN